MRRGFSVRAAPKHECATFLLAEGSVLFRAVKSQETTELLFRDGRRVFGNDFGLPLAAATELGVMFNFSERAAIGPSLFAVVEEFRHRLGGKLRYRFWENPNISIDLAVGIAFDVADNEFTEYLDRRDWIVGSLGLSYSRLLKFVFQFETLVQDFPPERRVSAFYAGLQATDYPGYPVLGILLTVAAAFAATTL